MTDPLWRHAPSDAPRPPDDFLGLVAEFRDSLREILGPDLAGLGLYGAAVFPRPARWRLDVDFQVLLEAVPSEARRSEVNDLHARLNEEWPLGEEMDGHYILLADAGRRRQPDCLVFSNTDDAWALHRAHLLAGRLLHLTGTDPREIVAPPDWTELRGELADQLGYIRDHPQYAAYGVLNSCRVLKSVRERDVVQSKAGSAEWGREQLPEWREAIDAAVREYTGKAEEGDEDLLLKARVELLDHVSRETELG